MIDLTKDAPKWVKWVKTFHSDNKLFIEICKSDDYFKKCNIDNLYYCPCAIVIYFTIHPEYEIYPLDLYQIFKNKYFEYVIKNYYCDVKFEEVLKNIDTSLSAKTIHYFIMGYRAALKEIQNIS